MSESNEKGKAILKSAVILDGSYFFLALYKLEGQWKKKIHSGNTQKCLL